MNEADWERWIETFDGFNEKLKDRAETIGSDALETLGQISAGCGDPDVKRELDGLERQIENVLELYGALGEESKSVISAMDDELDYLRPIAAERLAEQFALPLEVVRHKAIVEWCEENLQSHYWHYRKRPTRVLVIIEDNEKVMFKLRWGDTIPDLMP